MDAVAITIISVVGTALFAMFYMQFNNLRDDMRTGFDAVNDRLDSHSTGLHALNTEIHNLDTKFTAEIKDLEIRLTDKFHALDNKFTNQLRGHGERLARIEAKLGIDPPAEAA